MRSRDDIMSDWKDWGYEEMDQKLILEVLLDIRDAKCTEQEKSD